MSQCMHRSKWRRVVLLGFLSTFSSSYLLLYFSFLPLRLKKLQLLVSVLPISFSCIHRYTIHVYICVRICCMHFSLILPLMIVHTSNNVKFLFLICFSSQIYRKRERERESERTARTKTLIIAGKPVIGPPGRPGCGRRDPGRRYTPCYPQPPCPNPYIRQCHRSPPIKGPWGRRRHAVRLRREVIR